MFGGGSGSDNEESKAADPPPATPRAPDDNDGVDSEEEEKESDESPSTIVSNIVPMLDDDDVNLLDAGEDMDDYESDTDVPSDMAGEIAPLDDIQPFPQEEEEEDDADDNTDRVTDAFMTAIGGAVNVEAGALNTGALRAMQWEAPAATFSKARTSTPA